MSETEQEQGEATAEETEGSEPTTTGDPTDQQAADPEDQDGEGDE